MKLKCVFNFIFEDQIVPLETEKINLWLSLLSSDFSKFSQHKSVMTTVTKLVPVKSKPEQGSAWPGAGRALDRALGVVSKKGKVDSQNEKTLSHRSFQDMPEPQRFDPLFFFRLWNFKKYRFLAFSNVLIFFYHFEYFPFFSASPYSVTSTS